MTLPMNTEWREDMRGSPWALLDMMNEHALLGGEEGGVVFQLACAPARVKTFGLKYLTTLCKLGV